MAFSDVAAQAVRVRAANRRGRILVIMRASFFGKVYEW
jgi:hypothetical protein